MSEYIKNLMKAITAMHECRCNHFGTEHVVEVYGAEELWKGDVEIFQLEDHPVAKIAYGWGWQDGDNEIQYIGVLQKPPVESATGAVKAAIASGAFG